MALRGEFQFHCEWVDVDKAGHEFYRQGLMLVLQPYVDARSGTTFSLRNQGSKDNVGALWRGLFKAVESPCVMKHFRQNTYEVTGKMAKYDCDTNDLIRMKFDWETGRNLFSIVSNMIGEKRMPPLVEEEKLDDAPVKMAPEEKEELHEIVEK